MCGRFRNSRILPPHVHSTWEERYTNNINLCNSFWDAYIKPCRSVHGLFFYSLVTTTNFNVKHGFATCTHTEKETWFSKHISKVRHSYVFTHAAEMLFFSTKLVRNGEKMNGDEYRATSKLLDRCIYSQNYFFFCLKKNAKRSLWTHGRGSVAKVMCSATAFFNINICPWARLWTACCLSTVPADQLVNVWVLWMRPCESECRVKALWVISMTTGARSDLFIIIYPTV